MKYRAISLQTTANGFACGWVFLMLLFGSLSSQAATSTLHAHTVLNSRVTVVNDFKTLAMMRPQKCIDKKNRKSEERGWREKSTQCAWGNLLQMRRWKSDKDSGTLTCLSNQALWWSRTQSRISPTTMPVAWNRAWHKQSLVDDSSAIKRIGIVERRADGSWIATEWSWAPSPRAATRRWQEARWKLLRNAAMQMRQSEPRKQIPLEESVLKKSWEKNLKGNAGEVSGGSWYWQRDGLCLRMGTIGISQAQLQIPYSKEDSRLEQRAAMQIQLARTYPTVTWLTPFRLMPLTDEASQGGAKFEAIWMDNATVTGQIWIPEKIDGSILCARITALLPKKKNNEVNMAKTYRIADVIDRELIGLAMIWTVDHAQ
ncbi:MAG: hypothetical protein Q8R79_05585 [Legionellaceae bacterium]|nr:hypothetical protein [Legionellaceae bacterium]